MILTSDKRELCKNFYMIPNEIMRLGLSAGEIAVYNYLMIVSVPSLFWIHVPLAPSVIL